MANFVSNVDTDLNFVNMNAFLVLETGRNFQDNANLRMLGQTFTDALTISADSGDGIVKLIIYGPSLSYNPVTKSLAGTFTGFQQYDTSNGDYWRVTGLNVSASLFMTALQTPGTADDLNLIKHMFRGNDTFFLSNYEDDWHGYAGNDRLDGRYDVDHLYGDAGNDTLNGGAGDDFLFGGANNDSVNGGLGRDMLYGGTGNDTFVFKSANDSWGGTTNDHIRDFVDASSDRIDLSAIDARTDVANNQSFRFIGTADFSGHSGELRYKTETSTIVLTDTNGDKRPDFQVTLDGHHTLHPADFIL
jgi:Ca2+-binding RTX toxin-like protein